MDRGRSVLRARASTSITTLLAAALVAGACSSIPEPAADTPRASDIRALRWLTPGADRVRALTRRPAACLRARAPDEDVIVGEGGGLATDAQLVETGRLVFESPALLGGAAARMGLSCSSCHLNGRGNPDFFLEGMSDKPGTADVTSSLLSKVRGDGTFNPVPVPDLAAKDGKQIKDRKSGKFRTKVHGLIVGEFDGQEPPARVFEALLIYLDRLDAAAGCNNAWRTQVRAGTDLSDAAAALERADAYRLQGSSEDALLMGRVARAQLERLHERFISPDQRAVRDALVSASRAIEDWMTGVRSGAPENAPHADVQQLRPLIERQEGRSLYNVAVLEAALAADGAK